MVRLGRGALDALDRSGRYIPFGLFFADVV